MASTKKNSFKYRFGNLPLPVFFPDATRGVVKSIDTKDLEETKTPGILVNTYHLYKEMGTARIKKFGGIGKFMGFSGAIISDSGGFQVGSLIKQNPKLGRINDMGAHFRQDNGKHIVLTPEESIRFQMGLGVDMVVVLDDFTDPKADRETATDSVRRTLLWAERSKEEFIKICKERKIPEKNRPYILGVAQGGKYQDLRESCVRELVKIGFDGLGYGGWPINEDGGFDYESAKTIAGGVPENYFLYGLGVGKPDEIVECAKLGFNIFDCVLPTRDARHGRLYVYNFDSIEKINIEHNFFYSFLNPEKQEYLNDTSPVSLACDCLLCKKYSKGYLTHLFRIGDFTAGRLATIHNLRFYSLLMDKIRKALDKK